MFREMIKIPSKFRRWSARDLYDGLEVKSNFTTWFDRICEYGFTENDYQKCFPNLESGFNGGQNMIDYQISVDMAKQICMIQRSDKGKQYRQYFLDLENATDSEKFPENVISADEKYSRVLVRNFYHHYNHFPVCCSTKKA